MKKLKKLIALILAVTIIVSTTIVAFASKGPTGNSIVGNIPSYEEQLNSLKTETERRAFEEKHATLFRANSTRMDNGYDLKIPYSRQETDYYCLPASVQMTLKYVDGTSPSQSRLASAMGTTEASGTTFSEGFNYLRANCKGFIFGLDAKKTINQTQGMLKMTLSDNVPIILCSKFSKGGGWLYTTSVYHTILVAGQDYSERKHKIVDPYVRWVYPSHVGYYTVDLEELHESFDAMIW